MNFDVVEHLMQDHFYAAEFTGQLDDDLARALHDEEHAESRWRHTHGDDVAVPEGPRR